MRSVKNDKEVYILLEFDKATGNFLKVIAVYKRYDRANSVFTLLKAQKVDKVYKIVSEVVL